MKRQPTCKCQLAENEMKNQKGKPGANGVATRIATDSRRRSGDFGYA